MQRLVLDGALYSFCLPDGSWGALYPGSHIQTEHGRVDLPGEDVLFLVGQRFRWALYMAGQGHQSGIAWLWDGTRWQNIGLTHGVSPCAFNAEALFVAVSGDAYRYVSLHDGATFDRELPIGSQGIRYVSGNVPIPGDATYTAPDGQLHEYTIRNGIVCGQGHETDALLNGRVLEPGHCTFIRFERDNAQLAIALVQMPLRRAVLHWLTAPDIAGLPAPSSQLPAPIPIPTIPEPVPMNEAQIVAEVRHKYPTPLGVTHGACLIEIATALGNDAGLLRKDTGTFVVLPDGTRVSQDIICYANGRIFDCLGDAEGQATPGWSEASGGPFPERHYRVSPITPLPFPVPVPTDDAAPARLTAIETRLRRLEEWTRGV